MSMLGILVIVFVITLLLGIPVGFSILLSSVTAIVFGGGGMPLTIIAQRISNGAGSFTMLALPLFILSGNILAYGCTPRLVALANMLFGRMPGSIGAVTSGSCAFFGAVSGSPNATTAAVGGITAPEMLRQGYKKGYAASLLAASGGLGALIPPSTYMVVYASIAATSIGEQLMSGFLPGILVMLLLMLYNGFICKRRGYGEVNTKVYTKKEKIKIVVDAIPPLLMPVLILGGITSGIITPTESATIATVYAFILSCLVYKELPLRKLPEILLKSITGSSMILFIIACSAPFGWVLTTNNVSEIIRNLLFSISDTKFFVMGTIVLILLFLGLFMETSTTCIICVPIFLPIVQTFGITPVQFGVIMALAHVIGNITPPLAVCLYTATSIVDCPVEDTVPDVFVIAAVEVLALIVAIVWAPLATFLPSLM